MSLPPGKKPLREVEQQPNAANRVIDLAILLDFALASLESPSPTTQVTLSERIKRHSSRFPSLPDLMFAVGVRNDLVHATSVRRSAPREPEIKRAAKHLRHGLLELLPHLDAAIARAIVAGSHADPERAQAKNAASQAAPSKRRTTPSSTPATDAISNQSRLLLGSAIVILLLIVVPPLLKRWLYGSESAAEDSRWNARTLAEKFDDAPEPIRRTPAYEAARAALNSGDHWWTRMDYAAAAQRYSDAVRRFEQVEERLNAYRAAEESRTAAELARDRAIANRAAQEDPTGWGLALDTLAAATKLFDSDADDFGAAAFARAAREFEASSGAAQVHRDQRLEQARAAAENALARGEIDTALESWLAGATEGDLAARTRFDEVAVAHPDYFERVASRRFAEANATFPDRLRACLALAKRKAARPAPFTPAPLLATAFQDALRVADPENAADFLIEIARSQLELGAKNAFNIALRAAAEPLAVIRIPSNAILRYAQLAALASRASDPVRRDEFLELARQPTLTENDLSRLPQAIYLADSGDLEGSLAEADALAERPADHDYAQLAYSWIALRAAQSGNVALHRRSVLSISSLAELGGRATGNATPIDGSQARGAITLLKLVEADLALGRPADADRWRIAIQFAPLRAAADYALAEHLANHSDLERARTLFDPVNHQESTFGAGAAAAIASAMIRSRPTEPYLALEWAIGLPTSDLVLASVGAIAQELARGK